MILFPKIGKLKPAAYKNQKNEEKKNDRQENIKMLVKVKKLIS